MTIITTIITHNKIQFQFLVSLGNAAIDYTMFIIADWNTKYLDAQPLVQKATPFVNPFIELWFLRHYFHLTCSEDADTSTSSVSAKFNSGHTLQN